MQRIPDDQPNANEQTRPSRVSLPYLPWYSGDFMSSTRGWSVTARGVYRELLDSSWDIGGLPAEPAKLRALIGATPAEWSKAWPLVEPKFPIDADGLRRNARLEQHRGRALQISSERAKAGRLGGHSKAARNGAGLNGAGPA